MSLVNSSESCKYSRCSIASLGTHAGSTAARRVAEAASPLAGAHALVARSCRVQRLQSAVAAESSSAPRVAGSGPTWSGDGVHYVVHYVVHGVVHYVVHGVTHTA